MSDESSSRPARPAGTQAKPRTPVLDQLLVESHAMLRHALALGMHVPVKVVQTMAAALDDNAGQPGTARPDIPALTEAHTELAALVAPATPRMLAILDNAGDTGTRWKRFTRVPLIPQMMAVAVVALLTFIGLSLSDYVNHPEDGNIVRSQGLPLLVNELFFLSAAAIGAAFSGLFEAMRFIQNARFDPRQKHIYWIKLLLGLIAGLILATMFQLNQIDEIIQLGASHEHGNNGATSAATSAFQLTSAGLALLGGFSASLLYRVLTRLTDAVETMVTGEASTLAEDRQNVVDEESLKRVERERVVIARELTGLSTRADAETRAHIEALLAKLLGKGPAGANPAQPAALPPAGDQNDGQNSDQNDDQKGGQGNDKSGEAGPTA